MAKDMMVPPTAIDVTERQAANAAQLGGGPRVSKQDIENAISEVYYVAAEDAAMAGQGETRNALTFDYEKMRHVTICMIVMTNGFVIIGKSAPISPANFDPVLGRQIAYEDAFRQLWPLMGFSALDHLRGRDTR